MYKTSFMPSFARDMKRCSKKHLDIELLKKAMDAVAVSDEMAIPASYNTHVLKGSLKGAMELHIGGRNSDWLLIYEILDGIVVFSRTGSHDELFRN